MAAKYNTIEEFKAAVVAGKLSNEEFLSIMKSFGSSSDSIPEEFQGYKDKSTWRQDMVSAMESFKNSPQAKQYARDILKEKSGERFVRNFKPLFNTLIQGADIVTSISQIKQGNQALKGLVQPAIPQSTGTALNDINNQLYNAQRGTFDSERALAPIKQAANDEFNVNINRAKQVSGGQSGQYGSLAQSAANQRMRSLITLPQVADQIRAREQARADQLLGLKANYEQQDFRNRLAGTQMANDQYNTNVQAAGDLVRQGNINLRNVFQTLPDNILNATGRMFTPNPVGNPYNDSRVGAGHVLPTKEIDYKGDIADYSNQLVSNLHQHYRNMTNRGGGNQSPVNPALRYKDPNYDNYGN